MTIPPIIRLMSFYSYTYPMNSTAPPNGPPGGQRPSLDQIIWMGIGSNPGKMLVNLPSFGLCVTNEIGMVSDRISCGMYAPQQDTLGHRHLL